MALEKYGSGKFKLSQLIAPAIDLARHGYKVGDEFEDTGRSSIARMARWPSTAKLFLKPDGSLIARGTLLVQSDLAATLEAISKQGPRAFYEGPVADKISAAVREAGGLMTSDDLKNYQGGRAAGAARQLSRPAHRVDAAAVVRRRGAARDAQRAGGLQAQGRRSGIDCISWSRPCATPTPTARTCSAIRISSRRRSRACCRSATPRRCARSIDRQRATPSDKIKAADPAGFEGNNTTHFSVVDRFGNAVANTYTLNLSYGVGLIAEGTGVLLNNELDDFAAAPGAPNAFGLVGYEANEPGPNKRPLSSMTPTIVLRNGKPFMVTGSPGGSRIITAVLQVLLNVIDYRMPIAEAVQAPRIHHQWLPDETMVEAGVPPAMMKALAGARPQCEGLAAVHLGQSDPGDARRLDRRRRHADARRAGGRILNRSSTLPSRWTCRS